MRVSHSHHKKRAECLLGLVMADVFPFALSIVTLSILIIMCVANLSHATLL